MRKSLLLIIFVFAIASTLLAQDQLPKTISGGVLNGKAITLPKPEYPAAARKDGATGQIGVQVLIDESGSVVTAKAVGETGHAALRAAAETAALQAKFQPTLLSGQPVKVSGVISYNFVREREGYEEELMPMMLGMMLRMTLHLADHPESIKELFEGEDVAAEILVDFPQFGAELKDLSKYQAMQPKQRAETASRAFTLIRPKIPAADKWQFELGAVLGDLTGPFAPFMNEKAETTLPDIDLTKLEPKLKAELVRLSVLTATAPETFPKPLLEKFKALAAESSKKELLSEQNFEIFFAKMTALFETISPN